MRGKIEKYALFIFQLFSENLKRRLKYICIITIINK